MSYAEPRAVTDPGRCYFYHVMDLPGLGPVGGHWDLRQTIDEYLGGLDFRGKRVLDVGAASGFLSFEMEKRGAEVVSFDMAPEGRWDVVPYNGDAAFVDRMVRHKQESWRSLTDAYWLAHAALGSRARVCYGDIYDIPDEIDDFDVVVLGAVLLHLRDPFRALESASRRARARILVTDLAGPPSVPVMEFLPARGGAADTWWRISEECVARMMETLGFEIEAVRHSRHTLVHGPSPSVQEFYTMVGRRG